jgi:uncharacterized cupin superfamily protein
MGGAQLSAPKPPAALVAGEVAPVPRPARFPAPFAPVLAGRDKRRLGDAFGLTNFGVNLTRLAPGGMSALRHAHTRQDEFVYILDGEPTLITDSGETPLRPGMCAGFKAGSGESHHLVNRTDRDVVFLEVGDRSEGDVASYPDADLAGVFGPDRVWRYTRKDGSPL